MTHHSATQFYSAFVRDIEAFLARNDMAPTMFGRLVAHDPSFVKDLRGGRRPNLEIIEHVRNFMADYDRNARVG